MMPYRLVIGSRVFKRTHCSRLRGSRNFGRIRDLLTPDDEVSTSLRNVAIRSPRDAEWHPRRTETRFHITRPTISAQSIPNFSSTIILRTSFNVSEGPYQNVQVFTIDRTVTIVFLLLSMCYLLDQRLPKCAPRVPSDGRPFWRGSMGTLCNGEVELFF